MLRLGVALAIGLLIGFERGWSARQQDEGTRIAGLRTFATVAVLGGLAGGLAQEADAWVLAAAFLSLGALVAGAHFRAARTRTDLSITTLTALLCTFALGSIAAFGHLVPAGAAAVVLALILGFKPELHNMLRGVRRDELLATIRLLLITVVVLPILPDRGFGPYEVLNPYRLWLMVVLVAAISYVGYLAVRIAGLRRGILLTALFGGLSSSTAVALNLARMGRENILRAPLLSAGVVTASAMMFPRTLAVVALFHSGLATALAPALGVAGAVAFAGAWWLARADSRRPPDARVGGEDLARTNPLDLPSALKFGALLAAILVLARVATETLGEGGLVAFAAFSGLADVDAITLSIADGRAGADPGSTVAVAAVCAAATVNTIVKVALVTVIAGVRAGVATGVPLVCGLFAGAGALWLAVS